jgi:hypothetical protein
MDPSILIPVVGTVVLGACASTIMANRRIRRVKRELVSMHINAMTAVCDSAVELLCIDHGVDIVDAQNALTAEVKRRLPDVVMVRAQADNPQWLAKTRAMIEAKRAAKKAAKESSNAPS